jgi:hypothetical protein
LKLVYETGDLRRGEYVREVFGDGSPCYVLGGHGGYNSLIQTPGGANRAGVIFGFRKLKTTGRVGRKDADFLLALIDLLRLYSCACQRTKGRGVRWVAS